MRIEDRVFLIAGGASGLGLATASALVAQGARVLIADLQAEAAQAVARRLGGSALAVGTDVCDARSAQAVVDAALQAHGALHGLVQCAGIAPSARLVGRDGPHALDLFARVMQVNLLGSFNLLRLAAAAMAGPVAGAAPHDEPAAERGVIVLTASIAAQDGQIGQVAYAASKGGVAAMVLPAARELARHGIRVMGIAPGVMATPMVQAMPEAVQRSLAAGVPFPPRLGQADEFARLVLHVIENPYLNGEVIRLDGALRMAPR